MKREAYFAKKQSLLTPTAPYRKLFCVSRDTFHEARLNERGAILLLALTSIALVVGGVGIMNVMYVSVTERTSEIGLRKALGATSDSILLQFLFEALIITLLGGIIGIALGVATSFLASAVFNALGYDFALRFTFESLLLGAGFSLGVGLIFGLAPAYRAANLSPMEALRKE